MDPKQDEITRGPSFAAIRSSPDGRYWIDDDSFSVDRNDCEVFSNARDELYPDWAIDHPIVVYRRVQLVTLPPQPGDEP